MMDVAQAHQILCHRIAHCKDEGRLSAGQLKTFCIMGFVQTPVSKPGAYLRIIMAAKFASNPGTLTPIPGPLGWTGAARLIWSKVLKRFHLDTVPACQPVGARDVRIMRQSVIPNGLRDALVRLIEELRQAETQGQSDRRAQPAGLRGGQSIFCRTH